MDPSKKRTFFHFMQYTQGPGQNVTTDCGASLRNYGWAHDVPAKPSAAPLNWQCYVASKQGGAAVRHQLAAAHGPGPLLGVPRSEVWMAERPRAVRDDRPDAIKYAGLPEAFDWSATHGTSFIEPMRDQLTCGSCYAFAGTSMIAARARVKSNALNDVNLMLSPQARAHTAADVLHSTQGS